MLVDEAEPLIDGLPELFQSNSSQHETSLELLMESVRKAKSSQIEAFGNYRREKAYESLIHELVKTYTRRRMSAKFPHLDGSLFDKQRWIGVQFKPDSTIAIIGSKLSEPEETRKDVRWVNVPLIAHIDEGDSQCTLYSGRYAKTPHFQLVAEFPGSITRNEMKYACQAKAELYRITADLLESDELSDYAQDLHIHEPEVHAYWIPTLDSIGAEPVPAARRDPALVLEIGGDRFLCCMWDATPLGEEPLEAILREFSSGGTVKKSRKR